MEIYFGLHRQILQVYVGTKKCGTIYLVPGRRSYMVACGGARGSTIKITQKTHHLNLAEVQVYGECWDLTKFFIIFK